MSEDAVHKVTSDHLPRMIDVQCDYQSHLPSAHRSRLYRPLHYQNQLQSRPLPDKEPTARPLPELSLIHI